MYWLLLCLSGSTKQQQMHHSESVPVACVSVCEVGRELVFASAALVL